MTTDNAYFIKGSNKDQNIITYEKGSAPIQKMTISNIVSCVMKGFGTGVGGFSNCATILYSMAAIFDSPEQKAQHDELMTRIKLLREIVGQEIDRIKGAEKPFLPHDWKETLKILPTDSPEQRLEKFKHNAMVITKKPYFFRYLYPQLNQHFKQFEASYNQVSRDLFGIKFKKLLTLPNKTPEQIDLIRKYQKYSPLITSKCTMNRLCREIESVDYDIQFSKGADDTKIKAVSMLPTYEGYYASSFSPEKLAFVKKLYVKYTGRKLQKELKFIFDDIHSGTITQTSYIDDYSEIRLTLNAIINTQLQTELADAGMSGDEFLFYCSRLAPTYANFNWAFAWDILEDQLISLIPYGKSLCPIRDPEHGEEYLGTKYSLLDVSQITDLSIQKLINSIFGDPESSINPEYLDLEESLSPVSSIHFKKGGNTTNGDNN